MIGFWTRDVASAVPRAPLSPLGPMPRASRGCSWPTLLEVATDSLGSGEAPLQPTPLAVPEVCPAWEAVSRRVEGDADPWAELRLAVPEESNNHFFVKRMDEFLFDAEPGESDEGRCVERA